MSTKSHLPICDIQRSQPAPFALLLVYLRVISMCVIIVQIETSSVLLMGHGIARAHHPANPQLQ